MTSTYTSNSGIEKPATGDQSGTWGSTTNTNFDIIDQAISGVVSLSLSGTSSTLTTSDGSTSDGGNKVLVLGGSPSGTHTITISPNDAEKVYIVANNSGQDVIFTQGSGGNVTVSNGRKTIIFADGAGSTAGITDSLVNIQTTAFGSFDATTALKISGTAVTSTAAELNLLDGSVAGTIVNSKGVVYGGSGEVNATTLQIGGASITATSAELNTMDGITATTAELNIMDGVTATTAELNYTDGVTSNIQTQLDAKQATITGGATSIASSDLTASRAVISDGSGKVSTSATTSTEIGYVSGVTSAIQTQIDAVASVPTGTVFPYAGTSAPTGYLLCFGQSLSTSTYADLFAVVGYTYGGSGSNFNLPDMRGRTVAGQDDMGGSSANRLTGQSGGVNGDTLGGTGGAETHTLTEAQMPAHNHAVYPHAGFVGGGTPGAGGPDTTTTVHSSVTSTTGSSAAHNNVQPTLILNYMIKT